MEIADLSQNDVEQIKQLEGKLRTQSGEQVILLAYRQ
jgi:hypothetical protein